MMKKTRREKRHKRIAKKIKGTKDRPRLVIFRSQRHIYAQIMNDALNQVIIGCSTLSKEFSDKKKNSKITNIEAAKEIGKIIAHKALKLKIKTVCFDRGGYKYHGRVKSLADGAREEGLKF